MAQSSPQGFPNEATILHKDNVKKVVDGVRRGRRGRHILFHKLCINKCTWLRRGNYMSNRSNRIELKYKMADPNDSSREQKSKGHCQWKSGPAMSEITIIVWWLTQTKLVKWILNGKTRECNIFITLHIYLWNTYLCTLFVYKRMDIHLTLLLYCS